ncbi:hypothetical protein Pla163_02420 [Planctomycetes bacterium Pla163]|uniref:Schlafen group 3-like DNA/RNA helicase domain-containing protein n=1 Tax=Rohdeia mirabilis TaxID=2528008 RepID=A0A518CV96_9BACT|nr:hypothetical protein Pla163_02420 [Planctomycetes bacterium Pla163]
MNRAYFDCSFRDFCAVDPEAVLGRLVKAHGHATEHLQRGAWEVEIAHLQSSLKQWTTGHVFLELSIPRMGKRADAVLLLEGVIFVLEYKVGESNYTASAAAQALDYALDLKNFHAGSREAPIVPIVVATRAQREEPRLVYSEDAVFAPLYANSESLVDVIEAALEYKSASINAEAWRESGYEPTPTIVEAARTLYAGHSVAEISRSDAGAINLSRTAAAIDALIDEAKAERKKIVCFVTGVPGSGKTLAGLNVATRRHRAHEDEHAVFLSGNDPLVTVLREALARDDVERARVAEAKVKKDDAKRRANSFIQNVRHFRDDALTSRSAPAEHVVVFDEAQRAWDQAMATKFMQEKRGQAGFNMSEPQFLLSVMDRHTDWAVVVCLVGGGQEINTGEAGLMGWFDALWKHFPGWTVAYSDRISGAEYFDGDEFHELVEGLRDSRRAPDLHLGVSLRSFRSESVAAFVSGIVRADAREARRQAVELGQYPFVLTRDIDQARRWLREKARGSERFGLVASSGAVRLKPSGLHVKTRIKAAEWFLNPSDDVRSSFALEDAATEFDIQGLELDWVGVCWDANFRYGKSGWSCFSFVGTKWNKVHRVEKVRYLTNAYRVLLTRARQGVVIYVPRGDASDATRLPEFYDKTAEFLIDCGVEPLDQVLTDI